MERQSLSATGFSRMAVDLKSARLVWSDPLQGFSCLVWYAVLWQTIQNAFIFAKRNLGMKNKADIEVFAGQLVAQNMLIQILMGQIAVMAADRGASIT